MKTNIQLVALLVCLLISSSAHATTESCRAANAGLTKDLGVQATMSQVAQAELERRDNYQRYLKPGQVFSSPAFRWLVRERYLGGLVDKAFPIRGAGETMGALQKMSPVAAKNEAKELVDLLSLQFDTSAFSKQPGDTTEQSAARLAELARRANEVGVSSTEFLNLAAKINEIAGDPTARQDAVDYLSTILPEYGPTSIQREVQNLRFRKLLTPKGFFASGFGIFALPSIPGKLSTIIKETRFRNKWRGGNANDSLRDLSRAFENGVPDATALKNESYARQEYKTQGFTFPNEVLDVATASDRDIRQSGAGLDKAAAEYGLRISLRAGKIFDAENWKGLEEKISPLAKNTTNPIRRADALSLLSGPISARIQELTGHLHELETMISDGSAIVEGYGRNPLLTMNENSMGGLTDNLAVVMNRFSQLESGDSSMKTTVGTLGASREILQSQLDYLQALQRSLITTTDIMNPNLTDHSMKLIAGLDQIISSARTGKPLKMDPISDRPAIADAHSATTTQPATQTTVTVPGVTSGGVKE